MLHRFVVTLGILALLVGPCSTCGLFGDTAQKAVPVTAEYTKAEEPEVTFDEGEILELGEGYIVTGDVEVQDPDSEEWVAMYDGKPDGSGLIVVIHETARVKAPWGAWASKNSELDDLVDAMLETGCGESCETVIVIHWPEEPATPIPEAAD